MDISKEYFEMCEAAQEIQVLKPEVKEIYPFPENCNEPIFIRQVKLSPLAEEKIIWLPRQDQLQEMLYPQEKSFTHAHSYNFCYRAFQEVNCELQLELNDFAYTGKKSMEQIWLVIIMKDVYNKQWNKETKQWE